MAKKEDIQLTNDPLTNIYIMIPFLPDKAREAISYMMYGWYFGASAERKLLNRELSNESDGRSKKQPV